MTFILNLRGRTRVGGSKVKWSTLGIARYTMKLVPLNKTTLQAQFNNGRVFCNVPVKEKKAFLDACADSLNAKTVDELA